MVEIISKSSSRVEMNIDAGVEDRTLLARIDKKKKHQQNGGEPLPPLVLSPEKLIHSPVQGGGFSKVKKVMPEGRAMPVQTDQPPVRAKSDAFHPQALLAAGSLAEKLIHSPLRGEALLKAETTAQRGGNISIAHNVPSAGREKGDTLRQQVLFTAGRPASATTQIKSPDESKKNGDSGRSDTVTVKTESPATITPVAKIASGVTAQPVPTTLSTVPAEKQNLSVHTQTAAVRVVSPALRWEESQEVRPQLPAAKSQEILPPVQNEMPTRNKSLSTTFQQLKAQASAAQNAVKAEPGSQTVEVDYAFQRWSGDHSVKVSLSPQALREGAITLLPSDTRAAEALSRNMVQLTGLTPELLQPEQERDEQQQRQQLDEEQE